MSDHGIFNGAMLPNFIQVSNNIDEATIDHAAVEVMTVTGETTTSMPATVQTSIEAVVPTSQPADAVAATTTNETTGNNPEVPIGNSQETTVHNDSLVHEHSAVDAGGIDQGATTPGSPVVVDEAQLPKPTIDYPDLMTTIQGDRPLFKTPRADFRSYRDYLEHCESGRRVRIFFGDEDQEGVFHRTGRSTTISSKLLLDHAPGIVHEVMLVNNIHRLETAVHADIFALLRVFMNMGGPVTAGHEAATGNDDFLSACLKALSVADTWGMEAVFAWIAASVRSHVEGLANGQWKLAASYGLRAGADIDGRYSDFFESTLNAIDDLNNALELVQTSAVAGGVLSASVLINAVVEACPDYLMADTDDSKFLFSNFNILFQRMLIKYHTSA